MKKTLIAGALALGMTQLAQAQDMGPALDCTTIPQIDNYQQTWLTSESRQRLLGRGGNYAERDKIYDHYMTIFWRTLDERIANGAIQTVGDYFSAIQQAYTVAGDVPGSRLKTHSITPILEISSHDIGEIDITGRDVYEQGGIEKRSDVQSMLARGNEFGVTIRVRMEKNPGNYLLMPVANNLGMKSAVSMNDPVSALKGSGGLSFAQPYDNDGLLTSFVCKPS